MNTANSSGVRVVFDTNIYISAFTYRRGLPLQAWRQATERRFDLLVSPAIMREIARVLVVPMIAVDAVSEDATDNRILECAVAGAAHLVVSGDRHLLRLKSFEGVGIVRPVDLLRSLGA